MTHRTRSGLATTSWLAMLCIGALPGCGSTQPDGSDTSSLRGHGGRFHRDFGVAAAPSDLGTTAASDGAVATTGGTPTSAIYSGAYVDQWWAGDSVDTYISETGKTPSIFHYYENVGTAFATDLMDDVRTGGQIPMLSLQPWDGSVTDANFTLGKLIGGTYDTFFTQFAKDSKSWGHPYFLRFAHEMNGDWYPWSESINGNSPGQYVQAWRHVHDLFTAQGATNATWVWCPNVDYDGSQPLSEVYPGDDYVDWTCFDGYGLAWKSLVDQTYADLKQVAPSKPIMIGETGYAETPDPGQPSKAAWYTDVLTVELPTRYPQIQALVLFNQDPWLVDSGAASLAAYKAGIALSYYATSTFGSIDASPIPTAGGVTFP